MQELLSAWSLVYQPLGMCTNLEAPQIPYNWDFMEASQCGHDSSLTPFPAPLPSLENWGGAENPKLLNHGLAFLVTSPHPGTHPESSQ